MPTERTGRGPLEVRLEGPTSTLPRLYVRDGHGLVLVLAVPDEALAPVRAALAGSGAAGAGACDLELLDDRGGVASRWGHFPDAGQAGAVAAVLLHSGRGYAGARVVPGGGGQPGGAGAGPGPGHGSAAPVPPAQRGPARPSRPAHPAPAASCSR
ncbi:hypothetical protein [Kineococcus sp. SYSU DK006]|uniref:hypothetical protein n=1 Tax=Kineococcus sp. SYSU DK006 TaxID=3383127 RepID=UPI003D7D0755